MTRKRGTSKDDFASAPKLDILVFGPHPDDAEIGTGGVLLKAKAAGYKTGIVDMTEGEMATGGTLAIRRKETLAAAKILSLDARETLGIPDCQVEDTYENRLKVATAIRKYRPELVFAPYYITPPGRGLGHSDHQKTGYVVSHGYNFAHLKKLPVQGEPHQARALYYYFLPPGMVPTFIVDVTDFYEEWMASIMVHESQFGELRGNQGVRDFFDAFARQWGRMIGSKYAQAFFSTSPLRIDNPLDLVKTVRTRI